MTPEKVGRYEIKEELGRGGMATVFLAYDPHFERTVAIKVLPRAFLHEPEFRARFVREAKTIAALEHPAIVPVYDYGEDDGQPFLVMRHMPGGSLTDRLRLGPMAIDKSSRILQRIGSALDQAHNRGIIHRDLKPSNILFDQYGEAYLADFGIARLSNSASALTASGSLVGTPAYMSPEQVYGDKELDGRSDIYALGIILFQMLTGGVPYSADTPARLMMKHIMEPVPIILDKRPDLPPECDSVITKAMAKDREDRFSTATAMSQALISATQKLKRPELDAEIGQSSKLEPTPEMAEIELVAPESDLPDRAAERRATPSTSAPASGKKGKIPFWIWGMVGFVILVCMGAIGAISWLIANDGLSFLTASATATVSVMALATDAIATNEPTPAVDPATGTAAAEGRLATATARAALQLTDEASSTETLTATSANNDEETNDAAATRAAAVAARETLAAESITATAEAMSSGETSLPPLFGPENGLLVHETDDFVENHNANVDLANFVVRVTFGNPFAMSAGSWDMGLIFRQAEADQELRLVIRSDGTWNVNDRHANSDNFIGEGELGGLLRLLEDDTNQITLIVSEELGYFFLNSEFVTVLDLSTRTNAGDVALGTGFYDSNELEGASTPYQEFAIWPLETAFGPRSNQLEHVDDGLIKVRAAKVDLANFMADVVFRNPYASSMGGWDVGFSFRNVASDDQYWLIADSERNWTLIDRQAGEDNYLSEGRLEDFDVAENGSNRLTLIASNHNGYFLVNDRFVARLDLSARVASGDVEVVTAFFIGNEITGQITGYDDFQVWPLP